MIVLYEYILMNINDLMNMIIDYLYKYKIVINHSILYFKVILIFSSIYLCFVPHFSIYHHTYHNILFYSIEFEFGLLYFFSNNYCMRGTFLKLIGNALIILIIGHYYSYLNL